MRWWRSLPKPDIVGEHVDGPIEEALFDIRLDGVPVAYEGRHVKRPAPTAADYFVLQPGKSYAATVELSALYDLSATGDYAIRFRTHAPDLLERQPRTAGKPVPGFALADSVETIGNETDRAVRWKGGSDVSALAGKPVGLRFVMKDAKLYAYQFRTPKE